MRKGFLALTVALAVVAVASSSAFAKDEFEKGFKYELGAIAAQSAVGLGVGLVGDIIHGGVYYGPAVSPPVYVTPRVHIVDPPRRHYRHSRRYNRPPRWHHRSPRWHHRSPRWHHRSPRWHARNHRRDHRPDRWDRRNDRRDHRRDYRHDRRDHRRGRH